MQPVTCSYNGTLMAYGQTGAGKTYSLSSIAADAIGMIPRAAAEIFSLIGPGRLFLGLLGGRPFLRSADSCCFSPQQLAAAGPGPPGEPAHLAGGGASVAKRCPMACRSLAVVTILNAQLQDKVHEYTVYMSYVQLYMELIQVWLGWDWG